MLKAVIFDCDGVIADTEPLHFALFQKVLAERGIALTRDRYDERYLAMDDRGCFLAVHKDSGRTLSEEELVALIQKKTALYKREAAKNTAVLPGVVEFVYAAAQKYPLAVASGALREEVNLVLEAANLGSCFDVVVAAEDVKNGKPAPDAFLTALAELNRVCPGKNILPGECLVVEDSIHGVKAAHAAGMKCLAVGTSYPLEKLADADRAVPVLTAARLQDLEALF